MGKTVWLVPMFRCKQCGAIYHPHQFGIFMVEKKNICEQMEVKAVLNASEVHECDIDKIGIAVCVGFEKTNL